jgi:hypothetical protein
MKTAAPHLYTDPAYDALLELVKFSPEDPDWPKYEEHIQDRGWNVEAFLNYRDWVAKSFGTNYIALAGEHFVPIIPMWDISDPNAKEPAKFWNQWNDEYVPEEEFMAQTRAGPTVAWVRANCKLKTG